MAKLTMFGITEERVSQIQETYDNRLTDIEIREIVDEWGADVINRGYDISTGRVPGAYELEACGELYKYSDEQAAKDAAESGFAKIIPVSELPENFADKEGSLRYFGWIDTPENRKAIADYCSKLPA